MARTTRLSAGVVVAGETPDGWRFLLLRAFNHWDFPKGMVEAGEEPLAAAIREVREESLIDDLEFVWGDAHTETGPYSRGKVARYYVARTRTVEVTLPSPYHVLFALSANDGRAPADMEPARRVLGYEPRDRFPQGLGFAFDALATEA